MDFFVENCIQRIQRNHLLKILRLKNLELFYHFRILNKKTLEFLPESFVTVVEIDLACPAYVWRCFFLFENCANFLCLFSVLIDLSSSLGEVFRHGSRNRVLLARRAFRGNFGVRFFLSSFPQFSDLREIFRTSVDNCSAVLSKLHSLCERNKLKEVLFWLKQYEALTILGLLDWFFRTLSGNFWQFLQFRILSVERNILYQNISFKQNFYQLVSARWAKPIRKLARSIWAGFSELQLPVHSNVFMTNVLFEKRINFSIS